MIRAADLYRRVHSARVDGAKRYSKIRQQIEFYHGKPYEGVDGTPEPENSGWSYATHTVARLLSLRSRVSFATKRSESRERTEALEMFVDPWRREGGWERLGQEGPKGGPGKGDNREIKGSVVPAGF